MSINNHVAGVFHSTYTEELHCCECPRANHYNPPEPLNQNQPPTSNNQGPVETNRALKTDRAYRMSEGPTKKQKLSEPSEYPRFPMEGKDVPDVTFKARKVSFSIL